jgi:multicomponent Na+:H+ antiporter subunit E
MILLFLYCVILAFIWMLLMSTFTLPMFVAGFLVGAAVLGIYYSIAYVKGHLKLLPTAESWNPKKFPYYFTLFFVFFWELLKANWAVLVQAFKPKMNIAPGIVALPIDLETDAQIMLLANMITLTPGTISIEVSPDNSVIYVHALDCSDPQGVIDGINKAFTRRLKGVKWNEFTVH